MLTRNKGIETESKSRVEGCKYLHCVQTGKPRQDTEQTRSTNAVKKTNTLPVSYCQKKKEKKLLIFAYKSNIFFHHNQHKHC